MVASLFSAFVIGGDALKIIVGGTLYLLLQFFFLLGTGGSVVVLATAAVAYRLRDAKRYDYSARFFGKLSSLFTFCAFGLVVALIAVNDVMEPSVFTIPFIFSVFESPLVFTMLALLASAFMLLLVSSPGRRIGAGNLLLVGIGSATSAVVASLAYTLINTFTVTPSLPTGALVVIQPGSFDPFVQMSLMDNRAWIPLTIKLLLVGAMSFSLLVSGVAVTARIRHRTEIQNQDEGFLISWGFKSAILFGAPLGILGYWNAAIMHASAPVLALGLMGQPSVAAISSIVSSLSPLWDIGIVGAMSLGGLASVYYLARGEGYVGRGTLEQATLRGFRPWLLFLLMVAVYAAVCAGEDYPTQAVLSMYTFVGGLFLLEAVNLYANGHVRLYVPAAIFAAECYGLIVYMAPHTQWYLASNFGGISWPLIGFPLLVVGLLLLALWRSKTPSAVQLVAALLAPLVIIVKSADVELMKGTNIMAIDPTVETILDRWGFLGSYDLSSLHKTYPTAGSAELALIIIIAYTAFLFLFYIVRRLETAHLSSLEVRMRGESRGDTS